ncbi:M23 family metallopeptidase [Croceibacterium sp. LX-88]|uniref:M23 family metallopeptidase n=1 Tax=Croceibacterium selenioxidans TaxID=2838833 RepID=A0ABS5W6H0_9SPHN|nr:M23 family metallopeptidase [Croceibacterium selenioxidans]
MRRFLALALGCLAVACVAPHAEVEARAEQQAPSSPPQVQPASATFVFGGELTQGGWIRGEVPPGTVSARLGETAITFDGSRRFFAAFDRDAGPEATLVATMADGRTLEIPLSVSPRAWNIENINASPTANVPSEEFLARRKPELERIAAARQIETGSEGWLQTFIWPATGRISGRFGSQRVYRGEPGSYHSGIDVAGGTGTTYVAPADGIVVLAAQSPYTLEGNLLIIDHGMGLSSAFLHSSELLVHEGEAVKQGQPIGRIGATGRATGPHLHWGLVWRGARLDPLLFTGPMP